MITPRTAGQARDPHLRALWIVRADNPKTGIVAGAAIGIIIGSVSAVGGNEAVLAPAILGALGSTVGAEIGKRSPRRQSVYARP